MVIQTECGLFASLSKKTIPISFIINNLKKLNHRGRDCYGISYLDEKNKPKDIREMLNWKTVDNQYDDQLYYTEYYLNNLDKYVKENKKIKLDYDCSVFQVLNGVDLGDDFEIIYSKGLIKNVNGSFILVLSMEMVQCLSRIN